MSLRRLCRSNLFYAKLCLWLRFHLISRHHPLQRSFCRLLNYFSPICFFNYCDFCDAESRAKIPKINCFFALLNRFELISIFRYIFLSTTREYDSELELVNFSRHPKPGAQASNQQIIHKTSVKGKGKLEGSKIESLGFQGGE